MNEWAVTLDVALEGMKDQALDAAADDVLDLFESSARNRGASMSVGNDRIGLTLTGFGPTVRDGLDDALAATMQIFGSLGLSATIVSMHARSYEDLERE